MARQGRSPHPSPLQMLAILHAHANDVSAAEIHARTGHSRMSVWRWFDAWGHDAKTFDNIVREQKVDISGITFDDFYPKAGPPLPSPFVQSGERTKPTYRFKTALGLK